MSPRPAASAPVKRHRKLRFFTALILLTAAAVLLVNLFVPNPAPDDLPRLLTVAERTKNKPRALEVLDKLHAADPANPDYIYRYARLWRNRRHDPNELMARFGAQLENPDPAVADNARLGIAELLRLEHPQKARVYLDAMTNPDHKYRHLLLARVSAGRSDAAHVLRELRLEIETGGALHEAVPSLSAILLARGDFTALASLAETPGLRRHIPIHALKRLHLHRRNYAAYLFDEVFRIGRNLNLIGFVGDMLIAAVWLVFLKRLDIFEPEKPFYIGLTFAMGCAMPFAAMVLYDIAGMLDFHLTARPLHDLLYCIFGIGLIEESVKLIPFLLMLTFTREVDESVDYIIYASVSALGFAFVENLIYFTPESLFIIDERGMICAIGHMMYTSLAAYILLESRRHAGMSPVRALLLGLLFASCVHGLYDFFLLSRSVPRPFVLLSLALDLFMVLLYNRMINNALNASVFFNPARIHRTNHLIESLGLSLMLIVLFEYVALSLAYGPAVTTARFAAVILFTLALVSFLAFRLGRYTLTPRKWIPLLKR